MYAFRVGMQKFGIKPSFRIESVVRLYARWIREGRLRPSSAWNRERRIRFTVQDPCQLVRKGYGDAAAEDLRFTLAACVGPDNVADMWPNRSANYCCGGGGGFLQSGRAATLCGHSLPQLPFADSRPVRALRRRIPGRASVDSAGALSGGVGSQRTNLSRPRPGRHGFVNAGLSFPFAALEVRPPLLCRACRRRPSTENYDIACRFLIS